MKTPTLPNANGGFITMYSGKRVSLLDPQVDDIDIRDIVTGLSNCPHWVGQTVPAFSVAQHSVLTWQLSPMNRAKRFAALMHDAPEAYLGDVSKPLKIILGDTYAKLEANFQRVICLKFDIDPLTIKEIKPYDVQAQQIEYDHFFMPRSGNSLTQLERIFQTENTCWSAEVAREMFFHTFNNLQ